MLSLTPRLSPLARQVIGDPELLPSLVRGFGSPLNVLMPQAVADNVGRARQAINSHHVRHRLFLAHKPNRSQAVLREAATIDGLGIDVASEGELRSALVNGFPADRIEATGPKSSRFLRLAIQHGVLLNADSLTELDHITTMYRRLGRKVRPRVVLRLADFVKDGRRLSAKDTKFGVSMAQRDRVLDEVVRRRDDLDLRGFSFHFSSFTGDSRAVATESALQMLFACVNEGLEPDVVNVGGGFAVNYLAHRQHWLDYVSALKASIMGEGESMTWNRGGFGMRAESGVLKGSAQFPDFYRPKVMEHELEDLLRFPLGSFEGRRTGDFLSEHGIELHLEPGKAMWDQGGLTIARVLFCKRSMNGEHLVALDMNRSNLDAVDQELFTDPIVVPASTHLQSTANDGDQGVGVYFIGNLCLSTEMITRHKTFLRALPEPGDLVVFANTAGYFMDFTESGTLMQRTAAKVAVWSDEADGLCWARDEDFEPTTVLGAAS